MYNVNANMYSLVTHATPIYTNNKSNSYYKEQLAMLTSDPS